ncbi:MAG: RNA polymerase sigma-70 factor [Bacteroidales bacterium]
MTIFKTHDLSKQEDLLFLKRMRSDDKGSFESIFNKYYKDLVLFSSNFVSDPTICEDIVQNVFMNLWEARYRLEIEVSLRAYLIRSVRNSCLEELRHHDVVGVHQKYMKDHSILDTHDTENYILYTDLHERLQLALSQLPECVRESFEMNRFQNLKYREIAHILNVSVRTVEDRVSKSLHHLRKELKDFCAFILFF